MPRPLIKRLLVVVALTAMTLVGGLVSSLERVEATTPPWLDTTNREAVINAYRAEFDRPEPNSGWNGDRNRCMAGTTSQAFRDSIFSRINYFRSMAGVPAGVTENATYSAKAQEAALMMAVTGRLSHNPDTSFGCYTSTGREAAGSSNLYYGRTGEAAITGYMEDPGAGNSRVGHRSWILHPTTRQMGTGDIPYSGSSSLSSNALWAFDNVFGAQPALREGTGFVAWPPRGYVPGEVVFPRWSFSLRGADFSRASVSMSSNGGTVNAPVVHRDRATGGAPFPVLVWEPTGVNTDPAQDTVYRVTVSGVQYQGATRTYSYDVIVIGDQMLAGASTGPSAETFESFVNQAYQDFVGRAATANELSYWTGRLAGGMGRHEFVFALSRSDAWTSAVVEHLYLDTLGRPSDASGRQYWIDRLQTGTPVANVAAAFYGSPEYVALQGGTFEQWINDLYGVLLHRRADNGGLGYWVSETGRAGTGRVAYGFYQSSESRQARVRALYQQFLGRDPDAGGLVYWSGVLANGDDLQLAAFLASSDEYWNRAQ